jgi:hypothetical protein
MTPHYPGRSVPPVLFCCAPAFAEELPHPLSDPPTGREWFLAAVILVMIACGLLSYLLAGRISERTHVAFAMLSVFSGAFGLLVLFGGSLYQSPLAAVLILLLLIVLFKFMSQFESNRQRGRNQGAEKD